MNSARHFRHRQRSPFRPRWEHLERRDCPSCTVFQTGDTLFILGDAEANHIAIADTREGGISVTCDGSVSQGFTGVQRIDVKTFGGDDDITAGFIVPPDNFEWRSDLGDGNDRLLIRGFDPQPDPPRQTVLFNIQAGAGDDTVAFAFEHIHFRGQFLIAAEGGAGNDRLSFGAIVPCLLPESELRIGFDGGAGDDQLAVRMGVAEFARTPNAAADILANSATEAPAEIEGIVRLGLDGGAGDDQTMLDVDNVDIRGALMAEIAGDQGADLMRMRMTTGVDVFGVLDIRALGGAGNDVMESFIVPCLLPGGRGRLLFDGEAGDDRIAVRVEQHEGDEGALDARVQGGLGDDDLTLALFGVEHLSFVAALVDGGRGHDVAHVTSNVRVANCEEVFFLDEPR